MALSRNHTHLSLKICLHNILINLWLGQILSQKKDFFKEANHNVDFTW